MKTTTPLPAIESEERRAHRRLAAFRSKLYRSDGASPMATEIRLRELERQYRGAVERLHRARQASRQ